MVITMMWVESWTVVIMSVCILSVIGMLLTCCICWESKRNSLHRFYVLDENGITKIRSSGISSNVDLQKEGLFRHLSIGTFKPNLNFLNNNDRALKALSNEEKKFNSQCDLARSIEIADSFDNAVLRLNGNTDNIVNCTGNFDKDEDAQSCISNESKYTFYSTYHMARTLSMADTVRSASSQPDLHSFLK